MNANIQQPPRAEPSARLSTTKAQIKALLTIASKGTPRICGVAYTGQYLVATDGHRLVRARARPATPLSSTVLLPRDLLDRVARAAKPRDGIEIEIDTVAGTILVTVGPTTRFEAEIDASLRFPEWESAIPDFEPWDGCGRIGVNPAYIGDAAKLAKAWGEPASCAVAMHINTPLDPIVLTAAGGDMLYFVMPMRI